MQKTEEQKKVKEEKTIRVPVLNIRMMSDDEWNRLAYRNWLERNCCEKLLTHEA